MKIKIELCIFNKEWPTFKLSNIGRPKTNCTYNDNVVQRLGYFWLFSSLEASSKVAIKLRVMVIMAVLYALETCFYLFATSIRVKVVSSQQAQDERGIQFPVQKIGNIASSSFLFFGTCCVEKGLWKGDYVSPLIWMCGSLSFFGKKCRSSRWRPLFLNWKPDYYNCPKIVWCKCNVYM